MSNIIDLLEKMGRDAQLRHASRSEVELALTGAQVAPELRTAILAKDQAQFEALLGQCNVCCAQFPGKDDEDEDSEESPSREGEDIAPQSVFRALASAG